MTHYSNKAFTYTLRDIPLFCGLTDEQLEDLHSHTILRHYDKGSIVFYEGDQSDCIHILLEGTVKLYKTSPSGKEVYLHQGKAPSVVAMGPTLEKIDFPATCAFEIDGVVGILPLKNFYICLDNLDCTVAIISTMAIKLRELERRLHQETIFSSEAKVADFIIKHSSFFERLKNTEIASMLNLTPETLSRILSKLKKQNMITIEHHHVTILDGDRLYKVVETNCIQHVI
jgi:CRP/FNR family transcriptional regulator